VQEMGLWLALTAKDVSALSLPLFDPFSKSPSICAIWFVMSAKQMTSLRVKG